MSRFLWLSRVLCWHGDFLRFGSSGQFGQSRIGPMDPGAGVPAWPVDLCKVYRSVDLALRAQKAMIDRASNAPCRENVGSAGVFPEACEVNPYVSQS